MKHIDSKRDEILQAAVRLFARHGIDGTSVKAIGQEAGVTDAALYKHFASKEAVAVAVYMHYERLYTALADDAAGRTGPFQNQVRWLVGRIAQLHDEDPFGLLLLSQRYDLCVKLPSDTRRPIEALASLFQQGVEQGALPPQEVVVTAAAFIGAVLRLAVFSDMGLLPRQWTPMLREIEQRLCGLVGIA